MPDNRIEFEEVESMTKEEAINKIKKHFKGNKKYAPENVRSSEGNKTHNIHDFGITIYYMGEGKTEEYTIKV